MQQIMSNTSKVLIDQKTGNNLLYLPLDRLMQMTSPGTLLYNWPQWTKRNGWPV